MKKPILQFTASLFLLMVLYSCSCNNTKNISKSEFQKISFGSGGGFTGAVTEYEIKSNGDIIFTESLKKEQKKIKTIDKAELETLQSKINQIPEEYFKFNHPFNIYSFIETTKGRITWGDPAFPAPDYIKELYEYLNKIINQ